MDGWMDGCSPGGASRATQLQRSDQRSHEASGAPATGRPQRFKYPWPAGPRHGESSLYTRSVVGFACPASAMPWPQPLCMCSRVHSSKALPSTAQHCTAQHSATVKSTLPAVTVLQSINKAPVPALARLASHSGGRVAAVLSLPHFLLRTLTKSPKTHTRSTMLALFSLRRSLQHPQPRPPRD